MDGEDIDDEGMLNVWRMLRNQGDSVLVVHCGDHFELRCHRFEVQPYPPMHLTDDDIEHLKQGSIVWN